MKIDIDLNTLTIEELKTVVALAERQKPSVDKAPEPAKPVVAEATPIKVVKVDKKPNRKSKVHRLEIAPELVSEVVAILQKSKKKMSIRHAFRKAVGKRKILAPPKFYDMIYEYAKENKIDLRALTTRSLYGHRPLPVVEGVKVDEKPVIPYPKVTVVRKVDGRGNNPTLTLARKYAHDIVVNGDGRKTFGYVISVVAKTLSANNKDVAKTEAEIRQKYVKESSPSSPLPAEAREFTYSMFTKEQDELMHKMIRNAIDRGLELTYEVEGKILDLTPLEWDRFIEWFAAHSFQIARRHNAMNHFKVKSTGKSIRQALKYDALMATFA